MGQKSNPNLLRLQINKAWKSIYYAEGREYGKILLEDYSIRKNIESKYSAAQINDIIIRRPSNKSIIIDVAVRKPGVIIGKSGEGIEALKKNLQRSTNAEEVSINVEEIKKPDLEARLILENIAVQIAKNPPSYKKAIKRAIANTAKYREIKGIKVCISGRLGGAEIARQETFKKGTIPLHTFRANIEYCLKVIKTTFGVLGVKLWLHKEATVKSGSFANRRQRAY